MEAAACPATTVDLTGKRIFMNHSNDMTQEHDPMNDNNDNCEKQDHSPDAAPEHASGLQIALMGSEGSGKTSFFAGLAWLGRAMGDSGFGLVGRNEASQKFVTGLRDTLARGEVPPPTHDTAELALDVLHGGLRIGIDVADAPGEEFKCMGSELQTEHPLFRRLLASQYMLLCLDIEKDVEGTSEANADRLEAALNLLTDARLCNGKRKLAVLLTKSDLRGFTGKNATPAAARAYLAEKQPVLLKKIQGLGYETEFFFLASLGRSELDLEHPPMPFGYERLFGWIVEARKWQRFKDVCRKHPLFLGIVALVLLSGLSVAGWKAWKCHHATAVLEDPTTSKEEKEKALPEASGAAQDQVADQLVTEILKGVDSYAISDLDTKWEELAKFEMYCSGNLRKRIQDAEKKLKNRRETLHLEMIHNHEKAGGEEQCRKAIANYRNDVAMGKSTREKAGDVDEIEKRLLQNRIDGLKAEIRAAVPEAGKVHTLLERCDLVDAFPFEEFDELKADKDDAKLAVAIGRRLGDGRPFQLTIYKGNKWLQKARRTRLEVTILGQGKPPQKSKLVDSVEPQWDTEISLTWKPGEKIRLQWVWDAPPWKGGFTTTLLAEETFTDPWTALLDILGGCDLKDTGKADSVRAPRSGEPRVFINSNEKEFENPTNALAVFKKFICPGDYWK